MEEHEEDEEEDLDFRKGDLCFLVYEDDDGQVKKQFVYYVKANDHLFYFRLKNDVLIVLRHAQIIKIKNKGLEN